MIEYLLGAVCLVIVIAAFLGGGALAVRGWRDETIGCVPACGCGCHRCPEVPQVPEEPT